MSIGVLDGRLDGGTDGSLGGKKSALSGGLKDLGAAVQIQCHQTLRRRRWR